MDRGRGCSFHGWYAVGGERHTILIVSHHRHLFSVGHGETRTVVIGSIELRIKADGVAVFETESQEWVSLRIVEGSDPAIGHIRLRLKRELVYLRRSSIMPQNQVHPRKGTTGPVRDSPPNVRDSQTTARRAVLNFDVVTGVAADAAAAVPEENDISANGAATATNAIADLQ
jgi:hypothetical protein